MAAPRHSAPAGPGPPPPPPPLRVPNPPRPQLADGLHIQLAQSPAAGVGDEPGIRVRAADDAVHHPPELEQALLLPFHIGAPRRVLRIERARQIQSRCRPEILPAVLAVAHPRARPAIAENAVHLVSRHYL